LPQGKSGSFFSTVEQRPTERREKGLAEQRRFPQAGVIVRSFAEIREGRFGDHRFDARIGSGGLQRDTRAHGFSESKNVEPLRYGGQWDDPSWRP
jgi:hypothetical protein